ncbi:unnamed protein product [Mycena citricolor]|uniref:Uncharacterized protein n=1 Tax=Mycena citricolor TaxID=2018698 RepID=A0AAD2GSW3_9AGAR|nr:unnamed protein product [Mycena citricolor]
MCSNLTGCFLRSPYSISLEILTCAPISAASFERAQQPFLPCSPPRFVLHPNFKPLKFCSCEALCDLQSSKPSRWPLTGPRSIPWMSFLHGNLPLLTSLNDRLTFPRPVGLRFSAPDALRPQPGRPPTIEC